MPSLFRNTLVFVVGYLTFMLPTYLLPWLGSNSSILNAVGVAIGHGMSPLWWLHSWCLVILILMTWIRGNLVGEKYLSLFPCLAAVFDLTPGLSLIPLIPTTFHFIAIFIGVKVADQQQISDDVAIGDSWSSTSKKAGILAGLMTAVSIFGSVLFVRTSNTSLSEFSKMISNVPVKKLPTRLESTTVPILPEKMGKPAKPADIAKHSTSYGAKSLHVKKSESNLEQNTAKEVRYINLNE